MCGVVALIGECRSDERTERVRRMTASIAHRGPDSDGYLDEETVAFGFRRLAIIDLSRAGDQPMTSPDGNVSIIFNGEIYNYIELRQELKLLGHTFQSSSDTEVLLHAYLEWGDQCVHKLNGMWAFLLYDRRRRCLCGSRDRYGIKPLFVTRHGQSWLFASEIKALLASGCVRTTPNWNTISDYLVWNDLDCGEETFFEGVRRIAAATWFEVDSEGRYREHRFWSPPAESSLRLADAAEEFLDVFEDAMRLHQRSDVPLAVHLSGGLDSTSIACALRRVRSNPDAPLFAFSFMHEAFDESEFIGATIAATGATLRPISLDPKGFWDTLEPSLRANDEPVHSMTALVSYALMKDTAAHGIKVVLNGQGADESLAGYHSYFKSYWHELLTTGSPGYAIGEMRRFAAGHNQNLARLVAGQFLFTLRAKLGRFDWYRRLARMRAPGFASRWVSPDFTRAMTRPRRFNWDTDLREVLARSVAREPLPIYLRIEDRNAMAHSIESRVPFLDYRLVELALSLSSDELLSGKWNKWLLRRAMKGRIPESVRMRTDKMGFPVPAAAWMRGPLWTTVSEVLADDVVRKSGIFDTATMNADLKRFRNGDDRHASDVFAAAQFAVWWHHIMNGRSSGLGSSSWRH